MQQLWAVAFIGIYVVLVGVSTFLQKPLMKSMDAFQMNALIGAGMVLAATFGLLFKERSLPGRGPVVEALGLGILMGAGSLFYFLGLRRLPVSVAATLGVGYVAVTVVLAVLVQHESVTVPKVLGIVLTIAGVALLSFSSR